MNSLAGTRLAIVVVAVIALAASSAALAQNEQVWIGTPGTPLNWSGSTWTPIAGPPEAAYGEIGVINNGGEAFINSAATADAGGVLLGRFDGPDPPDGDTGTLEIRSGGVLNLVKATGLVTTDGGLRVGTNDGAGFAGTLRVLPGGTLTANYITMPTAEGSSTTLGGTASGVTTVTTSQLDIDNDFRIIGPNVNLTTSNLQLFNNSGLYTAEITGTAHSKINVSNVALLGGLVNLEFNGHTPTVGQSWTLIEAGGVGGDFASPVVTSNASLGAGQNFVLGKVNNPTNTQIKVSLENVLTLKVDRGSGAVSIANDAPAAIGMTSYSIRSAAGSLDDAGWSSLASQSVSDFQVANPSASQLGEIAPTGSTSISPGAARTLGNAFLVSTPEFGTPFADLEDLLFGYQRASDGATMTGLVDYSGTLKANNLVLTIDPATGDARIKNDSDTAINMDSYTIASISNSLLTSWDSLADQGEPGWLEAVPTTGRISELNPTDAQFLAAGNSIYLGGSWNTAGVQDETDLEFQFRDTTLGSFTGVVEFGSIGFEADFDKDGDVDGDDLAQWQGDFGVNGDSDANGDGASGGADFLFWQRQFGSGVLSSPAIVAVPEPTSAMLALAGACLAFAGVRRRAMVLC